MSFQCRVISRNLKLGGYRIFLAEGQLVRSAIYPLYSPEGGGAVVKNITVAVYGRCHLIFSNPL